MTESRPRFSILTQFYAWVVAGFMLAFPFFAVAFFGRHQVIPTLAWTTALTLSALLAVLFAYANVRCSSETLAYREGLLFVTRSMMVGWVYLSLVFVLPALMATFVASVVIALYHDITGTRHKAAQSFHRLVVIVYRHRLRP